jgi:hypothetical protein
MFDIILDAWEGTPKNPVRINPLELSSTLSKLEKTLLIALRIEAIMVMPVIFLPLIFCPKNAAPILCGACVILFSTLIAVVVSGRKFKSEKTNQFRQSKIEFYVKLDKTFRRYGLTTSEQLKNCLDYVNRELDLRRTNRSTLVTSIPACFSIITTFSSLLLTKLTEETDSTFQAAPFVFAAALIILLSVVLFYYVVLYFLPLISPRERRLSDFRNDLSAFLFLRMDRAAQQENLLKLINENTNGQWRLTKVFVTELYSAETGN